MYDNISLRLSRKTQLQLYSSCLFLPLLKARVHWEVVKWGELIILKRLQSKCVAEEKFINCFVCTRAVHYLQICPCTWHLNRTAHDSMLYNDVIFTSQGPAWVDVGNRRRSWGGGESARALFPWVLIGAKALGYCFLFGSFHFKSFWLFILQESNTCSWPNMNDFLVTPMS